MSSTAREPIALQFLRALARVSSVFANEMNLACQRHTRTQADLPPDTICSVPAEPGTPTTCPLCADYRLPNPSATETTSTLHNLQKTPLRAKEQKDHARASRDPRGCPLDNPCVPAAETKATENRPAAPRRPGGGLRRRVGVRRQGRVRHRDRRRGRRRVPLGIHRIHAGPGRDCGGGRGARRRGDALV